MLFLPKHLGGTAPPPPIQEPPTHAESLTPTSDPLRGPFASDPGEGLHHVHIRGGRKVFGGGGGFGLLADIRSEKGGWERSMPAMRLYSTSLQTPSLEFCN